MKSSVLLRAVSWLAATLLAAVFAIPATAQCLVPDGLDGPCCTAATATLPTFPNIEVGSKYICWRNCSESLSANILVKTQHIPVGCGLSLIKFTITNPSGSFNIWKGKLIATYTRTWAERTPTSSVPNVQVFRFLVDGDFVIDPAVATAYGGNQCVVPPSYGTYGKILVTGYIDYAFDCDTNTWSIAFALGHECDAFEHETPFSSRPGSFGNASRSYTWVGPRAGFVIDPLQPVAEGAIINEGIRSNDFTMPLDAICRTEEQVTQGDTAKFDEFCPCFDANSLPQITVSRLSAVSTCGSFAASTSVDVWPGVLFKSIGFWTDPNVYPGRETLHLAQGFFSYTEGCTGDMFRYYMKGVETQNGWVTERFLGTTTAPVSDRFIDLGTAIPLSGDTMMPAVGRRYISDRILALNVE